MAVEHTSFDGDLSLELEVQITEEAAEFRTAQRRYVGEKSFRELTQGFHS